MFTLKLFKMKKLILGSISLFLFSLSVILIQISCSKTVAQQNNNSNQVGKIVFGKYIPGGYEIWIANYDGTNAAPIPITLPPGVQFNLDVDSKGVKVSPDGQKLFFIAGQIINNYYQYSVYSCNIDGSNVQQIIPDSDPNNNVKEILEVYQAF